MLLPIKELCKKCTMCRLGKDLHEANGQSFDPHVLSNMQESKYVVMGQNPGFNECLQDEPFVGQAGQTFNKEIAKHGLSRDKFYITNILHCHTPGNRRPLPKELQACRPIVMLEMQWLKPRLIVTLGKFAFEALCPGEVYKDSMGSIKKTKLLSHKEIPVFPIYHPSGMNLAVKARRERFEQDIKKLAFLVSRLDKKFENAPLVH